MTRGAHRGGALCWHPHSARGGRDGAMGGRTGRHLTQCARSFGHAATLGVWGGGGGGGGRCSQSLTH